MRYSFPDVPIGSTVSLPKINTEQDTNWYRCKLPLLVSMLDRYYKAVGPSRTRSMSDSSWSAICQSLTRLKLNKIPVNRLQQFD